MICGVALAGAVVYAFVNSHIIGAVVARTLGPYSDAIAEHILANPDPDQWRAIAGKHHVIILVDAPGKPRVGFDADGTPLAPGAAVPRAPIQAVRIGPDGTRVTLSWELWTFQGGHLPLMAGLLFMVTAIVGTALWFLQRQLRPLAWLHEGVDAVARGDFGARVPIVREDEIGAVARAFNAMTERVGRMIEDRERLLADVSHELRSPIARMKVALELAPEGTKRDALARDLKEMESLIDALLEREALRGREGHLVLTPIDLEAIAGEVAAVYADSGPGVELVSGGGITCPADASLVKLLIRNLVDNAVKFSRPDSAAVVVTLEAGQDAAVVRVADDGCGIPPGSEERVFEPFVKIDRARGHHVGFGIGLNLCRRIVDLHGGTIRLLPRTPRGTEAVVTLPLCRGLD